MPRILKLFSLLFLCVFSVVFAESKIDLEKYQLYVTQVDPESHCFTLSNGMTCCKIKRQCDTKKLPMIGTEIVLYPLKSPSENMRSNMEEGEFEALDDEGGKFFVWIPQESEQYFLTVVSCQSVCTQSAGWVFSAVYENIIELSDGSKWATQMDHMFAKGDRVVVSTDYEFDIWNLINADMVVHVGTSRNNETYYYSLGVRPYQETTKE